MVPFNNDLNADAPGNHCAKMFRWQFVW